MTTAEPGAAEMAAVASTRWRRALLLGATVVVLYLLWGSWLVYPLKLLVVLFHEAGHALVTILTGGRVIEVSVDPRQGGHTLSQGGMRFLILNGGYLGSLAAGVLLLATVRRPEAGRVAAGALAVLAVLAALLWVPLFSFGFLFTILVAAGFAALARWASSAAAMWIVRMVGVFSVMYALLDIRDDVFGAPRDAVTDASMLAQLTHVPAAVWGLLWGAAGLALLWLMRRSLI